MGLAERFKEKIKEKDIYGSSATEQKKVVENKMYISNPVCSVETKCESLGIQEENVVSAKENFINEKNYDYSRFETLETEIINKIRKTPYWSEFSRQRQESMIGSYFEKRFKKEYSTSEKLEFIKNIFVLSNCK